MRKLICLFMFVCALSVYAQDIIIKTDSDQIKADVVEITETQVKYKLHDYADGPIYTVSDDEISSIKLANGTVWKPEVIQTLAEVSPLSFKNKGFYQGEDRLSIKEFEELAKKNSPEAWANYKRYNNMSKTGKGLIIGGSIGAALGVAGIVAAYVGQYNNSMTPDLQRSFYYTGVGLSIAGHGCLAAGIPLFIIGNNKKTGDTVNMYNQTEANNAVSVNLNVSNTGLGLALNF